ncbi:def1-coordinates repair and rna pol ii proteolysis in response to dna damage [Fusarium longipes]|uniref:Def1-coordinates repair and rna pol ii proteolysis in response to dna damage n=1 Tax=Fusarium longipes TaxID=694270 RepID=A0A395TAY3_9HYPO|nr:def1-coordinates repair and rna pol ii proteolysis in response to dna damage [Fusarium longipes]
MQCISAERSIGFCSTAEASERVVERAYAICNGTPNAVRPTHLTITATLVLDPSGRGVVTFPHVTISSTASSQETSSTTQTLPTTLVIDTSSPPVIPRPSTRTRIRSTSKEEISTESPEETTSAQEIISISEPPFTRSTNFQTTTSTSASEIETTTEALGGAGGARKDEEGDESNKLSTEQIAGISVGVLAAVGVAVGAIVLARYCRRRKYPQIRTGFLPMRDTWGYKADRSDNGGHNSWMVHQLRPDLDPGSQAPPPPAYNRANSRPENIGVALSPPSSNRNTVSSSPLRRLSKLLPAKPTLPHISSESASDKPLPAIKPELGKDGQTDRDAGPQIPPPVLAGTAAAASSPRSRPTPPKLHIPPAGASVGGALGTNNRESNVTEFEEDRTSMSPNNNNTQVWRPPPTTPLSATTYYVADQYGNWILGNPKRASVIARGSQDFKGSQGGASQSLSKDNNGSLGNMGQIGARTLAPPAEIVPASAQNKPYGPRPQYPSPFFSSQSHPRRSASSRRSITRPSARPREDSSSSSATIITTSTESSSSIPSVTLEQQVSLSPVAESPQSVRVRQQQQQQQQQQPQIPPRDPRRASQMGNPGDNINTRLAPPSRQIFYSPPGQPSPTLGMMQPPTAYNLARQQPGPQNTQTIPNVGLQTTSPTMRIVEPSPEPEESAEPPTVKPDQIRASPFYFDPPYPQPLQGRQQSQHHRSASTSQPQTYRPYQRPPSFQPAPHEQQAVWQPIQRLHSHHHRQQRQQPQQSAWQPAQRIPPSHQSFQQQPPLQPYQRPPHSNPYQQPPDMYQSFQARQNQQSQPRNQGGYQPFQPYPAPEQTQIHPSQYQNYRPTQPITVPLAHSESQDSLLAKRVGSDRAADMAIGTNSASTSKWDRSVQNKTPPSYPMSPHWKPTLTPTRRGDDLVLNVQ